VPEVDIAQDAARGSALDVSSDEPRAAAVRFAHPGMLPERQPPLRGAQDAMMNLIRSFVRDEQGEDLIEYGLLAAFAAAIFMILMTNGGLRDALRGVMNTVVSDLAI
jgi:Flp pilus assembly pilin Flp